MGSAGEMHITKHFMGLITLGTFSSRLCVYTAIV